MSGLWVGHEVWSNSACIERFRWFFGLIKWFECTSSVLEAENFKLLNRVFSPFFKKNWTLTLVFSSQFYFARMVFGRRLFPFLYFFSVKFWAPSFLLVEFIKIIENCITINRCNRFDWVLMTFNSIRRVLRRINFWKSWNLNRTRCFQNTFDLLLRR